MPDTPFKSLADDFNRSTKSCVSGSLTVDHALAKYSILMNHKAEQDEDRRELTGTLYKGALLWLRAQGDPDRMLGSYNVDCAVRLLTRLTAPDSLPYLPREAPAHLADAGLCLLLAAEATRKHNFDKESAPALVKMAEQTLAFADAIKTAQAKLPSPAPEAQGRKTDEKLSL